jgi:ATP-dependent RNA helicase RhlE
LSFSDFSISPDIARSIRDRGHHQATPIQTGAIPAALEGRDLIATAETGSGKTAAYLIPLLDALHRKHAGHAHPRGVRAMVLVPTRELAAQVAREFTIFARHTRLRAATIVGGESMSRQLSDLRAGAQVLIACPGRLIDHLERGTVKLEHVEIVVLDEADRMLDMGFQPQLRRIMRMVPRERQTLMFSATMPAQVAQVAREFLTKPERVNVGEKAAPPASIRQTILPVSVENKGPMLLEILKRDDIESAIVFTRTKSRADRVSKLLARNGIRAAVIHGDRSQGQRNAALAGFRARNFRILVATDIAARGLDIPHVSHVINFDLPDESENYIHRIGRTARMGREGEAMSLVTPEERITLRRLEGTLGQQLEREQVDGFDKLEIASTKSVTVYRSSRGSRRGRQRASWA